MAEIKGENVLVMENIEVSNKYIKDLSVQGCMTDFINNIFEYMKSYADMVGGEGTPVYMSTSYHKIGDENFTKFKNVSVPVTLIGTLAGSKIYMNTYEGYVPTTSLCDKFASFHVIRE
jgi:hypothetical protein